MKDEWTIGTLKEYFERIIRENNKAHQRALKLQTKEYKRRLKVLNGEGDRIKEILKESVPREVFDRSNSSLSDKVQLNTNYNNAQEGKNQLTKWIPWVIAAAALIYTIYKK